MIRVLIADDEIHVCQLVEHLVDWQALGLTLIGKAHSGVEAFERIASEKPDIVISDIRMSGFSGIDLMEKVRNLGINCRFILISGYREFEYAQRAITFDVTDYIVKPLKKNELESALRKAIDELGDQANRAQPVQESQPLPSHRVRLAEDISLGSVTLGQLTLSVMQKAYGLDFSGICMVIAWHFVCLRDYSDESVRLLQSKAFTYLSEQCTEWFREFVLVQHQERLFLVCAAECENDLPSLQLICDSCRAFTSILGNWETVLGATRLFVGESLEQPLERAARAARSHIFQHDQCVHRYVSDRYTEQDFHAAVDFDACSLLISSIQILDVDAVRRGLYNAFAAFAQNSAISAESVHGFVTWVCSAVNHALSAFETEAEIPARYLDRTALERELSHAPALSHMNLRLTEVICARLAATRAAVQSAENRPVRLVKELVAQHYMENLSLIDVAATVDLNPVYLSTLFKKETGTNFKDYLIGIRMDMAKKLLRDGGNITDVASMVGYRDAKYFSTRS